MTAPRIDVFRNTVDHLIVRLGDFRAEVQDVHDLAYNRKRAAEEAKVNGGSRDYALDTNGDMIARDHWFDADRILKQAAGMVDHQYDKLRSFLTAGTAVSTFDRNAVAPKHEVVAAINAAHRRKARGEYAPHPIVAQPKVRYVEPTAELEHLRNAVRKMAAGVKPDRSRLTPLEQEAWRKATAVEQIGNVG